MIEVERHPCERCGGPLYYHEQRERWCRPCAAHLGVERMCDHGRTSQGMPDGLQWARDRMAEARRLGATAEVLDRWDRWIAAAYEMQRLSMVGAPELSSGEAMQRWIAQHIEDPESSYR